MQMLNVNARCTEFADAIRCQSEQAWGVGQAIHFIGKSPAIRDVQEKIRCFADVPATVLIQGESGVGKELVARSLYLHGGRHADGFWAVNCAQFQGYDSLVSELFGHAKGSFTGAHEDKEGLFLAAGNGTAFLDEIGEMGLVAQSMLLRVLSEGEVKPLGSTSTKRTCARVIAATNRDVESMASSGEFHHDLYYRLRTLRIDVPPLRERGDDWRLLVQHVLSVLATQYGREKRLGTRAEALLAGYDWPGNVRELNSVMLAAYLTSQGDVLQPEHFRLEDRASEPSAEGVADLYASLSEEGDSFWERVHEPFLKRDLNRDQVRTLIRKGLQTTGGSFKKLLAHFGMEEDTYSKFMSFLRHHDLKPKGFCR